MSTYIKKEEYIYPMIVTTFNSAIDLGIPMEVFFFFKQKHYYCRRRRHRRCHFLVWFLSCFLNHFVGR